MLRRILAQKGAKAAHALTLYSPRPRPHHASHAPSTRFARSHHASHAPSSLFARPRNTDQRAEAAHALTLRSPLTRFARPQLASHALITLRTPSEYWAKERKLRTRSRCARPHPASHAPSTRFARSHHASHAPSTRFARSHHASHAPSTLFARPRNTGPKSGSCARVISLRTCHHGRCARSRRILHALASLRTLPCRWLLKIKE